MTKKKKLSVTLRPIVRKLSLNLLLNKIKVDSKQILKNNFSLFLCRDVFHQNTPDIIPSKVIRLTMNYKRNEINWYFLNEKKKTNQKCTTMCYISRESIERVRKIFNYNFYDENWFFPLRLQFVWVHLIKLQGNQRSDDFKNVTLYRMWKLKKKKNKSDTIVVDI